MVKTISFFVFCFMVGTITFNAPRAEAFTVESSDSGEREFSTDSIETGSSVREVRIYYPQPQERVHQGSSLLERVRFSARGGRRDRGYRPSTSGTKYYYRSYSSSPSNQSKTALRKSAGQYAGRPDTVYGVASWYGREFHGRRTANGEVYNMHAQTAAHRTLPFGTIVRVTNLRNGREAVVRINDRGPFVAGREIDLSYGVARDLGMLETGLEKVRLEILTS